MGGIESIGSQLISRQEPVETLHRLPLWIIKTGLLDYRVALGLQQELWRTRRDGTSHDILVILQHHPTITLGRGGDTMNLLLEKGELKNKGIKFYVTGRGN